MAWHSGQIEWFGKLFCRNFATKSSNDFIEETNRGHQLLMKMGWRGSGTGLGAQGQGIDAPISGGEVRDRQSLYKGVGMQMNDPYEDFRKNKGAAFISRMRSRDHERKKWAFSFNNNAAAAAIQFNFSSYFFAEQPNISQIRTLMKRPIIKLRNLCFCTIQYTGDVCALIKLKVLFEFRVYFVKLIVLARLIAANNRTFDRTECQVIHRTGPSKSKHVRMREWRTNS